MWTPKWETLTLNKPDGHPKLNQVCVIRRRRKDLAGAEGVEYIVGHFFRDERDPESQKIWWRDGNSHIAAQDPVRWKRFYTDVEWMDIDEEVRA